ncbi:MAG: 3'(2'),5'-bisphosphate nucleotidase CysQ [Magnetococcales bacterium]|nr:3'(2'),5'-bisphosphate nucleotidase CysQ [Magnetococcales bacterium]
MESPVTDIEIFDRFARDAALAAGQAILSVYRQAIRVEHKTDGSPLTAADRSAHDTIHSLLSPSGLPVISEEGEVDGFTSEAYWLVDPLDGTKDFLAGNDEFTVNIALMRDNRPLCGALYAPALDELYLGRIGQGVTRIVRGHEESVSPSPRLAVPRMVTSRFHDGPASQRFADLNAITNRVPIGSALKFGRLAFGQAEVYPRFVGTCEWDTAAGQAILEASGGRIISLESAQPLTYGKAKRLNPAFLAFRAPYRFDDFRLEPP